MQYQKEILLKNKKRCLLRQLGASDAEAMLRNFLLTHGETDYLLSYPEETTLTVEQEEMLLAQKGASGREVEIGSFLDGRLVGTAGVDAIGERAKVRHRAEFGIAVEKSCWGLGIGRALTEASIECAKQADYAQLELEVVAENESAIALYKSLGFVEYGRNPLGFCSRLTGTWQELILMRLLLK